MINDFLFAIAYGYDDAYYGLLVVIARYVVWEIVARLWNSEHCECNLSLCQYTRQVEITHVNIWCVNFWFQNRTTIESIVLL